MMRAEPSQIALHPISRRRGPLYDLPTMVANTFDYSPAAVPSSPSAACRNREAIAKVAAVRDSELVRRFVSGDEGAFDEIVSRYHGKMYTIALGHLRNHSDAEEIAQDTLIRAHRGLVRFRGDSSLSTWLHKIAFNLSRNRHMHNFRRRRHAMLSLDSACTVDSTETFADKIACDKPSPARAASFGEFSDAINQCLNKLGRSQREILVMRSGLSRSYGEIAGELGLKIGTVKSRIGRARETLRAYISEDFPEISTEGSQSSWFEPSRAQGSLAIASP